MQLAPRMAASAISEGPAMSWQLIQGVPCTRPETAGIGSIKNPCDPMNGIKRLQKMDGWMEHTGDGLPQDRAKLAVSPTSSHYSKLN